MMMVRTNNKKRSTKRSENLQNINKVKNIFERAKMSLIHKENEKKDEVIKRKDIKYGIVHSITNPLIKKKLKIKIEDDYSFNSKLIDERKTSIENLSVLTTQLNTIFSKFSEKKLIKKKGIQLNQSSLSTLSSSS